MKFHHVVIIITLVLTVVMLFLDQENNPGPELVVVSSIIDYAILTLIIVEIISSIFSVRYPFMYIREHLFSFVSVAVFFIVFMVVNAQTAWQLPRGAESLVLLVLFVRNTVLTLRIFGRIQKLAHYVENMTIRPAQTILQSFIFVILSGTFLLMMGFSTTDGMGLHFIDALFTSTSAVCVTGLIVVDTATAFTFLGKLIIMLLIQVGGLSIMVLSYAALFALRRKTSLADKLLLSYMLSEEDAKSFSRSLKTMIYSTIIIEGTGAVLLFMGFSPTMGVSFGTFFYSLFHSISAFCNAGFALFSNNLESYRTSPIIPATIAGLIILGGISFAVILNVRDILAYRIRRVFSKNPGKPEQLNVNSVVVLAGTLILIVSGMLMIYFLEHGRAMKDYSLGDQYYSAFFQSVTLRTAGFNTIPLGNLAGATYLLMIVYMFIGAASGGTAGGIKINTVALILARIRGMLRGESQVRLGNYYISSERVARSFIVLIFALSSIVLGTFFMLVFDEGDYLKILFEATSAFGTVGLSAGITSGLSWMSKLVLVFLMYFGRVGPLTILVAVGKKDQAQATKIQYPRGDISIG
ncbi:MAG: TrkH family potassium uptake protein [Spirochaetaceae bacterium]|nr:MAG: TrkH family potassium uptake protein [Spirochaetaceae bacterium]